MKTKSLECTVEDVELVERWEGDLDEFGDSYEGKAGKSLSRLEVEDFVAEIDCCVKEEFSGDRVKWLHVLVEYFRLPMLLSGCSSGLDEFTVERRRNCWEAMRPDGDGWCPPKNVSCGWKKKLQTE